MTFLNVEIKARCDDPARIRRILSENDADFKGEDHQVDTYFSVPEGRLKLREGNIENNLIYYRRSDIKDPKSSRIDLMPVDDPGPLKNLLTRALTIRIVVDKKREIYYIDNVKFHIDEVKGLGNFVEIEAIDRTGEIGEESLKEQCEYYMDLFSIREDDLEATSYSDLLLRQN